MADANHAMIEKPHEDREKYSSPRGVTKAQETGTSRALFISKEEGALGLPGTTRNAREMVITLPKDYKSFEGDVYGSKQIIFQHFEKLQTAQA